jgi:hypothetical protein
MTRRRGTMPKPKKKSRQPAHRPREEKDLRQVIGASVRAKSKRALLKRTAIGKRMRSGIGKYHIGRAIDDLIEGKWRPF